MKIIPSRPEQVQVVPAVPTKVEFEGTEECVAWLALRLAGYGTPLFTAGTERIGRLKYDCIPHVITKAALEYLVRYYRNHHGLTIEVA